MNVSSVGGSSPQWNSAPVASRAAAPAGDADGDNDGTQPGQVDTDDGGRAGRVDVRA